MEIPLLQNHFPKHIIVLSKIYSSTLEWDSRERCDFSYLDVKLRRCPVFGSISRWGKWLHDERFRLFFSTEIMGLTSTKSLFNPVCSRILGIVSISIGNDLPSSSFTHGPTTPYLRKYCSEDRVSTIHWLFLADEEPAYTGPVSYGPPSAAFRWWYPLVSLPLIHSHGKSPQLLELPTLSHHWIWGVRLTIARISQILTEEDFSRCFLKIMRFDCDWFSYPCKCKCTKDVGSLTTLLLFMNNSTKVDSSYISSVGHT